LLIFISDNQNRPGFLK